jgi:hypothetical protein
MASHPNPHRDLAGYLLGVLTPEEAAAFEEHLRGCRQCREEQAELGGLPEMLRITAVTEPPPALRARTFEAVAAAARAAETAPPEASRPQGPSQTGPHTPPASPAVPWSQSTQAPPTQAPQPPPNVVPMRPRRRAPRWLLATAAAVVLIAAVGLAGVQWWRSTGQGDVTTITLAKGDIGDGRGEAQIRSVTDGREVRLRVSGLPPNGPDNYYECWFVGPGDTEQTPNRVSAGTFTVGPDGSADVTMTSAADPARFPKMGVTLEPNDGNPQRTGKKALVTP